MYTYMDCCSGDKHAHSLMYMHVPLFTHHGQLYDTCNVLVMYSRTSEDYLYTCIRPLAVWSSQGYIFTLFKLYIKTTCI